MNNTTRILKTAGTQQVNKSKGIVNIGNAAKQFMDNHVSSQHIAFDSIIALWRQLLPVELVQHSRIAEISGGQLKVQVDSASYMYELQLCSSMLLSELQRRCSQVRVKEIKFVLV